MPAVKSDTARLASRKLSIASKHMLVVRHASVGLIRHYVQMFVSSGIVPDVRCYVRYKFTSNIHSRDSHANKSIFVSVYFNQCLWDDIWLK